MQSRFLAWSDNATATGEVDFELDSETPANLDRAAAANGTVPPERPADVPLPELGLEATFNAFVAETPAVPEDCEDRSEYCTYWAKGGYCVGGYFHQGQPIGQYWCPLTCGKCDSDGGGGGGSSRTWEEVVLDRHNGYRQRHTAPPLQWDAGLAGDAASWAEMCDFGRSLLGHGENAFASRGSFSGGAAVDTWYQQGANYDYSSPGYSSNTGLFTQVVWKATRRVGCAVKACGNLQHSVWTEVNLLICEYEPKGNVPGRFTQNVLQPSP